MSFWPLPVTYFHHCCCFNRAKTKQKNKKKISRGLYKVKFLTVVYVSTRKDLEKSVFFAQFHVRPKPRAIRLRCLYTRHVHCCCKLDSYREVYPTPVKVIMYTFTNRSRRGDIDLLSPVWKTLTSSLIC